MIDDLKKKVGEEIEILREISIFSRRLEGANASEKRLISDGLNSLRLSLKVINSSIPEILNEIEIAKPAPVIEKSAKPSEKKLVSRGEAMPKIEKKEEYLKQLDISESLMKKLKKKGAEKEEKIEEFKKARGYLRMSNKLFLKTASNLIKKGYFGDLPSELRRSNLEILFETYVAMMLFTVLLSFFAAILFTIFLLFFNLKFALPFVELYQGAMILRAIKVVWLPLVIPIVVFLALYYYPSTEKSSISKRIDEELPFAVIHMSSISGSGIEPTEIFKIIGLSKDYPFLKREIRKVLNQINIYGYDLVTALNNVSKSTSNQKLAELFGGLSTTINSGGNLTDFFQKRAETLLVSYKLEKEKSIKVAETFMDIYISVVIAAPMILMLMLVMISISGIQIGFTPQQLTLITIGGVALINIVFLGYLQTKQI
jgi:archaellum biogenesis protein FlaJ (TadC family)